MTFMELVDGGTGPGVDQLSAFPDNTDRAHTDCSLPYEDLFDGSPQFLRYGEVAISDNTP